jgi:hypothetical protein
VLPADDPGQALLILLKTSILVAGKSCFFGSNYKTFYIPARRFQERAS